MRSIWGSFRRLLGTRREAGEPPRASLPPGGAEETHDASGLSPDAANARVLGEITGRSIQRSTRACEQARAGQISEAIETIRRIEDAEDRGEALKHFSAVRSGPAAAIASHALNAALKAVEEIRDEKSVSEKAWRNAMSLAGAGEFTAAVRAAREIGDPSWRSWALQEIASARAKAGDFPAALVVAGGIGKPLYRSWAYRDVAVAQAEAGQIEAAADTARRVEDPEDCEQALAAIEKHREQSGG